MTAEIYPHESWHWRMAVATMSLGLFGLLGLASTSGQANAAGGQLVGLTLLGIALYAGWISKFWNRVRYLEQPHKTLVWTIAVVGFVFVGIFIVALKLLPFMERD